MKKIFVASVFFFLFSFSLLIPAQATEPLTAYFFYGEGCPHCAKEEAFLESIADKYSALAIESFEIYYNADNARLMRDRAEALGVEASGVPFLILGDEYFIGYREGLTDLAIEQQIIELLGGDERAAEPKSVSHTGIALPLIGEVDLQAFSLPVLAVVMGALDGFNPCAMWALLFLISLLFGMKSRRRMWFLGIAFIVTSALVYFLFMAAWLNLILFLGLVIWVRLLIALIALGGGAYHLKEFWSNRAGTCKISAEEKRQRVFQRLRNIVGQNSFWLALGGIIVLAGLVNLVELICSAGLPAVFTQVLAVNDLLAWQYYAYILLYIFFFMLDDLLVFFAAMITLQLTGLTTKYTRYSNLVGGLLMLVIGLLLLFRPEWLTL